MIKQAEELRDFIMIPLFRKFDQYRKGIYSPAAVNLCLGTIAQESAFKFYRQDGYTLDSDGAAFGFPQIELKTLYDVRNWFVEHDSCLGQKVDLLRSHTLSDKDSLIGNLHYSIMIERCVYLSIKRPLPNYNDVEGMAHYWNDYYNRNDEHGTPEEFIANYNRYLQP